MAAAIPTGGGAFLAAPLQQTNSAAVAAPPNAGGSPAGITSAGPSETSKLSQAATRDAAYAKGDKAFTRMTTAFGNLSDADKKDLGGQISSRLHSLTDGKNLTDAQKAELKYDTMAGVSAEWAQKKAGNAGLPSDAPAGYQPGALSADARNVGDLYYGGTEYLKTRQEYLNNGGQIGQ